MKKLLLILGVLFIAGCSNKQSNKSDLAELGLKGKVKSVEEITYEAVEKSGELTKGKRKHDNYKKNLIEVNISTIKKTFNEKGNLLKEYYYNPNESLVYYSSHIYNDKGKKRAIVSKEENLEVLAKQEYKFDDQGRKSEGIVYTGNQDLLGRTTFQYDSVGNIKKRKTYNEKGILTNTTIHKYNENNRLIETSMYNVGGDYKKGYTFEYYPNGNVKTQNILGSSKEREFGMTFSYNNKNDLIEKNFYILSNSESVLTYKYQYEYDKKSNWIKKIKFNGNQPKYIIERKITYYN